MKNKTQSRLKNSSLLITVFLLLALAAVSVMHFDNLSIVYCSLVYTSAYFYRRKSLCDKTVDRLVTVIYLLIISVNLLTIAKYSIFKQTPAAVVYLWYMIYVPMMFIPYFMLTMGRYATGRETKETMTPVMYVLLAVTVILCILTLTNNYHAFVFVPKGAMSDVESSYSYGPGFYLIAVLILSEYIAFLVTMVKKARPAAARKGVISPFFFIPVFMIYAVLYNAGILGVRLGFVYITSYDMYILFSLCIVESCISHGLFQVNDGYDEIFSGGPAACISDSEGNTVLAGERYYEAVNSETGDFRTSTVLIPGGSVTYAENVSAINSAISELAEVNARLKEENDVAEYEIKQNGKRAEYETKNGLLDEVTVAVSDTAAKINSLIDCTPDAPDFEERMKKACVLMSYVKRRADFTVARFEGRFLGIYDLHIALSEVQRYLEKCGVQCTVSRPPEENPGTALIIPAFETLAKLMIECLEKKESSFLEVSITDDGDAVAVFGSSGLKNLHIEADSALRTEKTENTFTVHLTGTGVTL